MKLLNYNSNKFKFVLLIFFIVFFASCVFAQSTTTIEGLVKDPNGAIVPGASVTLIPKACKCNDCNTNSPCPTCCAPQQATTDEDGNFEFSNVLIRAYTLKAEVAGFKSSSVDVNPDINATTKVEIVLDTNNHTVDVSVPANTCDLVCIFKKIFKKIF